MKQYSQLSLLSVGVSVASLLLASTASFAHGNYKGENYKGEPAPAPCPMEIGLKDGLYLGLQGGYDIYSVGARSTDFLPAVGGTPATTLSSSTSSNANGWVGGIFAGYGQYFNNMWYLAGEIFVNGSNAGYNNTTSATPSSGLGTTVSANNKFDVNASYGVSLLPGIKLNNSSLGYVRLGYNWANVKGTESDSSGFSASNSNTVHGFNYGVGVETLVYENVSIRGEYTYTDYSSFNSSVNGGTTKFSPSDNQFMLGVIYHFSL